MRPCRGLDLDSNSSRDASSSFSSCGPRAFRIPSIPVLRRFRQLEADIYLGGFVYLPIIGITSFAAMRIALDIQEIVKKGRHEYGSLKKAYAFCAGSIVIMSLAEIAMFVLMNTP